MSTGGWVILLIFVAIIIVMVFKWLQTDYDSGGSEIPSKETKSETPIIPVHEKKADYVTIYEFSPKKNVKVCRYCDGENPLDANHCGICGEEIDA